MGIIIDKLLQIFMFTDPKFLHTSNTQKTFLSWQSMLARLFVFNEFKLSIAWDLLCIDVYGFKAFCKWFLDTYPGYFISPLRISGSAVESLFSQYKYSAGGKLDATNYVTSRCAHLVKQCAVPHHSAKHCRDETVSFIELPLKKKQYNKSLSS